MSDQTQLKDNVGDTAVNIFGNAVTPLTEGVLKVYEPALAQVEKALKELTDKEFTLFNQVHEENLTLSEARHGDELNEMFTKIETYQGRLVNIKKDMKLLHEKGVKLKKRALKLQQFKEKKEYLKQQKEAEVRVEEDLVPKPNFSTT